MVPSNDKIFIDANFFIALFNPADSQHEDAKAISRRLGVEQSELYLSNFIFLEIVTILSQKAGRERSIRWGGQLLNTTNLRIVHIDEYLHFLTWSIFQQISQKDISFIDCSILAVMQYEGIKKLLTFDRNDFAPLKKKYSFGFLE